MVPDYYARLGVDPGAERAEIEAALKRLQPAWSMGTRNPKTRHTNQLYLDEIPALRKALLGDPASRAAYDAELAVVQIAERDAKLDELQKRARLRAAKGGLSPADRTLLVDEAAKLGLSEDDLLRVTKNIPMLVEAVSINGDAELDHDPPADVLDPSTRRQIRVVLDHLGCRDLYDALGVSRDAPKNYIEARADEERQRWMKKAQVTAEKTAWLEIITHGQSHLSSPKARARYDRTLAQEAEESFEGLAAFALKGLTRLDPGTLEALIDEAAALGIPSERADRLIGRICRRSGVTLEHGSVAPLAGMLVVRCAGPCQRRGQVQRAALPAMRGHHRIEPRRAQGEYRALPALRRRRSSGIARFANETPGLTNGGASAGFARRCVNPWFDISRRPSRPFATLTWPGPSNTWLESRRSRPTWPAPGTGSPRSARGRPISPAFSSRTRRRGPAAAWCRRGGRSKPGASSSTRNHPSSRRPCPRWPGTCAEPSRWRLGPGTWNGPIPRPRVTSIARAWRSPPTFPKP